jgi:hypothetical protein
MATILLHAVVHSDSSLVNGQQLICIKATKGTETERNSGRRDLFPKSYFQQTSSKTHFLELVYYVYLLGKHHHMSPLTISPLDT